MPWSELFTPKCEDDLRRAGGVPIEDISKVHNAYVVEVESYLSLTYIGIVDPRSVYYLTLQDQMQTLYRVARILFVHGDRRIVFHQLYAVTEGGWF